MIFYDIIKDSALEKVPTKKTQRTYLKAHSEI